MSIPSRVKWFLDSRGVEYDVLGHAPSETSCEAAQHAEVPSHRLAKCVVLEDERGYLMAVLPASERIEFGKLNAAMRRHLELAQESELVDLFKGCSPGAVPPLGRAYNIPTVVDDSLLSVPEVWFEAGDHQDLIHVRGAAFVSLLSGARHASFLARHG